MELLIAVVVLVAFAVLAVRAGHDSRDVLSTPERELARLGMTWDDGEDIAAGRAGSTRHQPASAMAPEGTDAASEPIRYAPR